MSWLTNQIILSDGRTIREHLTEEGFFGTPVNMDSVEPQIPPSPVSVEEFEKGRI
jgi:hypothetical protein